MSGPPSTEPGAATGRLLRPDFCAWLGAETLSVAGDGIFFFALAWTASGLGGHAGGLVLTLGLLPAVVLTVFGGALGDRWGLRRTLIGCNLLMCALLLCCLILERTRLPMLVLLCGLAVGEGMVSSVHRPANGAFPRMFFPTDLVPRAMSLTGSIGEVAGLAGPALGGIVVAALALRGAVWADLVSFSVVLAVLVSVRPRYEPARDADDGSSTLNRVATAIRCARHIPGTTPLLAVVAVVAGGILPMLSLCVPLLVRERGWGSADSGLIETSWVAGCLAVSLLVAKRGTRRRPADAMVAGPAICAVGIVTISLAPSATVAFAGAGVMGLGTAIFTSHVFPLYLLRTPPEMLARFQALLLVAQFLPTLVANNVLGAVSAATSPPVAMWLLATACTGGVLVVLLSSPLRHARLPSR